MAPSNQLAFEPLPVGAQREPMWVLPFLLLVGAALRTMGMERLPFEQDELYTLIESRHLYDSPLHPGIHARPLYYLLQHVLLGVFPVSHVSMRLLPVLFGLAGIAATWMLARKLFGYPAAIVAALLVVVSPWHLHASGMARYWSLVYLLSTLFLYFLFTARRHERARDYVAALVTLMLGAASHPTFIFPLAGIAIGFHLVGTGGILRLPWPDRQTLARLWAPAAVFFLLAYLLLTATQGEAAVRNWSGRGLLASIRLVPAMVEWATPVIVVAGLLGATVMCFRRTAEIQRTWGFVTILGGVCGTTLLFAASFSTDVYADYGIALLPLLFVSVGGLVQVAADRFGRYSSVSALVASAVLVAGVAPGAASYLSDGTRFDYRPALAEITAVAPDRPVVSTPIILIRHYAPELRGIELPFNRPALDAVLHQEKDVWAIIPVRRYGIWQDGSGDVAAWVRERCRLQSTSQRPRFDYRLYRTELYRCASSTA